MMRLPHRVLLAGGAVALGVAATAMPASAAGPTVVGSGSSFVGIELSQWTADVANPPYGVNVVYNAISSGVGRDDFASRRVDFAISDIPYPPADEAALASKVKFGYVPISSGGMAFMFNQRDAAGRPIKTLNLTPVTACKIFTGQIKTWSDPAIVADNPTYATSAKPARDAIKVVLRSGAAGTSYIFGQYCQKLAPDVWTTFTSSARDLGCEIWVNFPGPPLSQWCTFPGAIAGGSSDQNADIVANASTGLGAITLVEAGFAKARNIPVAAVSSVSHAKSFVLPSDGAVTKALSYAKPDPNKPTVQNLDFDPGDAAAYNPSTYSYAITPLGPSGIAADKGGVLAQFLDYCVTKGQEKASQLGYAPLPQVLIDGGLDLIAQVNGAPARPSYTFPQRAIPVATTTTTTVVAGGGGGGGTTTTTARGQTATTAARTGTGAGSGGGGGGGTAKGGGTAAAGGGASTTAASSGAVGATAVGDSTKGAGADASANGGAASNDAGSAGDGQASGDQQAASVDFQEQAVTTRPAEDSLLPLGVVLALGAAGFLVSRRKPTSGTA